MRRARPDTGHFRFESIASWRFPIGSRAVPWIVLGIVLAALVAVIAQGVSISMGRHQCAEACAERQYAFKEYTAASRFGTKPAVCTCARDGGSVEVPMR
jgi:uncharacterized membrane protein YraQ (UPF0718 family)